MISSSKIYAMYGAGAFSNYNANMLRSEHFIMEQRPALYIQRNSNTD